MAKMLACVGTMVVLAGAGFQEEGPRVGVQDSLTRVFRDEPFAGRISDALELSLARNEYEAGQIVLVAGKAGLEKVSVELSDLLHSDKRHAIKRDYLQYNFVGYTAPTMIKAKEVLASRKLKENEPKRYPDPLLLDETCSVEPEKVQPVWITVHAPSDAVPGKYTGTATLKSGDKVLRQVKLEVEVWDFTLPESSPVYVWYYNDFNSFAKNWLGVAPSDWDTYKTAFRHYVREVSRHRGSITLPLGHTDGARLDELVRIMIEEGIEYWWVTWLWHKYVDLPAEEQKKKAKEIYDYLKERGWLDSTFVITWDEPDLQEKEEANRAKWKQHISVLKEMGFPKIQVDMTWRCKQATSFMEPYGNVWNPQFAYFEDIYYDFLQKQRKAGSVIGMYCTGSGNGQEPRHYITYPLTDAHRLYYYMWNHGVTLFEYWAFDLTWRKSGTDPFSMGLGDGFGGGHDALVYPNPKKDPAHPYLNTLRTEAIRDGIEVYCYLWILSKLVGRAEEKGQKDLAETGKKVLAELPGKFGAHLRDYQLSNVSDYGEARKKLAETILKLKGKGPDVLLPKKKFAPAKQ